MKYARSENNIVVQIIGNDPANLFAPEHAALFRECDDAVQAGWLDEGQAFIAPPAPPVPVPQVVSFRQAKTQLQLAGIWDAAIVAANAIVDPVARIVTVNLLLDSGEYERQRPELIAFAKTKLGMTDAQLDALFIAAAAL